MYFLLRNSFQPVVTTGRDATHLQHIGKEINLADFSSKGAGSALFFLLRIYIENYSYTLQKEIKFIQ
jgi:hypothetical protein